MVFRTYWSAVMALTAVVDQKKPEATCNKNDKIEICFSITESR